MISSSVSNVFTFSFTILDLLDPIASPMCLTRIGDQNMFLFSQWSFYIFQICFISFKILPLRSHSKKKNEWISDLAVFAISAVSWCLCHLSASFWRNPSIDLVFYLFHFSKASIWAQAQPSSSMRSKVMIKTVAPIAPKMSKKTTTFMVVIQVPFLKMQLMKDFVMIRSCFTKVLRAKNRWETLSTLTFDLVGWGEGMVWMTAFFKKENLDPDSQTWLGLPDLKMWQISQPRAKCLIKT